MCGHGTIRGATVLVETGMVAVTEPETVVRLDVPAGLVEARVRGEQGAGRPADPRVRVEQACARWVMLRTAPALLLARHRVFDLPGLGRVVYVMAYGGNFY